MREQLIAAKLPLAWSLARRYMGSRSEQEDLRQVAALGLVKAVDRYDPSRGTSFSSFAVPTITGEIRRYIRDTGWAAHVSRHLQESTLVVARAADYLSARLGHSPTVAELAEETGLTREGVVEALAASRALRAESLDAPAGDDGAVDRYDELGADDDQFEQVESRTAAGAVIGRMPVQERELLRMRFGDGLTQRQIGEQIGVSQMHVSRLLRRAVERASILAGA